MTVFLPQHGVSNPCLGGVYSRILQAFHPLCQIWPRATAELVGPQDLRPYAGTGVLALLLALAASVYYRYRRKLVVPCHGHARSRVGHRRAYSNPPGTPTHV